MASKLPPLLFLSNLPGNYDLLRLSHHPNVVAGTILSYPALISPSRGTSSIIVRAPANREYKTEFLQINTIYLHTYTNQSANKIERYAFRIKDGEWSLWRVDQFNIVASKIGDLTMGKVGPPVQSRPGEGVAHAVKLWTGLWPDAWENHYMTFLMRAGRQVSWQLIHWTSGFGGGIHTCTDLYSPVVE